MNQYAKVFRTMYTGSMYGAGMHVFAVWGWILAHKDENGIVEVNPELVAHQLGGCATDVSVALQYLCAPDPNSRSKEHEGRRIVQVSQFGYQVVNHDKYRHAGQDRTEYWRNWRKNRDSEAERATVAQQDAQQRNVARNESATYADAKAKVIKKRKAALFSSEAVRLSDLLLALILARKPDFKRRGNWAKDIDLMIRLDHREPARIEAVIRWCQQDGFWANNILSGATLRKQYDKLDLQREQRPLANPHAGETEDQRRARLEAEYAELERKGLV